MPSTTITTHYSPISRTCSRCGNTWIHEGITSAGYDTCATENTRRYQNHERNKEEMIIREHDSVICPVCGSLAYLNAFNRGYQQAVLDIVSDTSSGMPIGCIAAVSTVLVGLLTCGIFGATAQHNNTPFGTTAFTITLVAEYAFIYVLCRAYNTRQKRARLSAIAKVNAASESDVEALIIGACKRNKANLPLTVIDDDGLKVVFAAVWIKIVNRGLKQSGHP